MFSALIGSALIWWAIGRARRLDKRARQLVVLPVLVVERPAQTQQGLPWPTQLFGIN
jgi:hypothetical protein